MKNDRTFLYSLTGAQTISLSNDIDVGADQAQVMEKIETYKIRHFADLKSYCVLYKYYMVSH